ncbi:MAG: protein kinase [Myxococcales bacterium]|nr:protein kinase [Myxococcales bacterium]
MSSPLPPTRLAGRYTLIEAIGEGGMGRVYRAHDEQLDRAVAVKVLRSDLNETRVKRFQREARAVARLNHPNIVTIHDSGESDGARFIVMELLEGADLATTRRLSPAALVRVVIGVCEALEAAHAQQIVHRDIKPQNIQVLPDGRVKLLDFGLALVADNEKLTQSGDTAGTLLYITPEQITGARPTALSDQYSLGLVTFEYLAGQLPHPGTSINQRVYARLHTPPHSLGEYSALPATLVSAIDRAVARDPEERHPTIAAFREALERALPTLDTPTSQALPLPAQATPELSPTALDGSVSRDSAPLVTASEAQTNVQTGGQPLFRWTTFVVTAFAAALAIGVTLVVVSISNPRWTAQRGSDPADTANHSADTLDPSRRSIESDPTTTAPIPDATSAPRPPSRIPRIIAPRQPEPTTLGPDAIPPTRVASRRVITIRPVTKTRDGLELVSGVTVLVNGKRLGISSAASPLKLAVDPLEPIYLVEVRGDFLKHPVVRRIHVSALPEGTLELEVELKW